MMIPTESGPKDDVVSTGPDLISKGSVDSTDVGHASGISDASAKVPLPYSGREVMGGLPAESRADREAAYIAWLAKKAKDEYDDSQDPRERWVHPSISARIHAFNEQMELLLVDILSEHKLPLQIAFAVKLSLEEALVNSAMHGNEGDPAESFVVSWHLDQQRHELQVTIIDAGRKKLSIDAVPNCVQDEQALGRPSGRGVHLIRHFMTEVREVPDANGITIVKSWSKELAAAQHSAM